MKWFEVIEDLGDGDQAVRRFKTREYAEKWAKEECYDFEEWGCYPVSDLKEVDTDNWFFQEDIDAQLAALTNKV